MKTIVLYLRCALANRFTLAGDILFFAGYPALAYSTHFIWVTPIGTGLLIVSGLGLDTLQAYHAAMRLLRRHGSDIVLEGTTGPFRCYCRKTGARLARSDYTKMQ